MSGNNPFSDPSYGIDQEKPAAANPFGDPEYGKEGDGDFVRGLKNYIPQTKQIGGDLTTLAGLGMKKAFGPGEVSQGMIDKGKEWSADAADQMTHKDTDEFTGALDKGVGSLLTDYVPYQAGQAVGMIGESLATAAAGAAVGGAIGSAGAGVGAVPGALAGGIAGAIEGAAVKQGVKALARKLLAEQGEGAARSFLAKEAAKATGQKIGLNAGLATGALAHGFGETGGRAIDEATKDGGSIDGVDFGRVVPAAIGHAGLEFVGDKIGLGAISKEGWRAAGTGAGAIAKTAAAKAGVTGLKEAPVEAGQTVLERYAGNLNLADAEAGKEYLNAAAAGATMGGVIGGAGGVHTALSQPDPATFVQPTPTAENPAPAPVPRPDPNAGALSRAAAALPAPSIAGLLPNPGATLYGDTEGNWSPDGQPRNFDRDQLPTGREKGPQSFGSGMEGQTQRGAAPGVEGDYIPRSQYAPKNQSPATQNTFDGERPALTDTRPQGNDRFTVDAAGNAVADKVNRAPTAGYVQGGRGMDQQAPVGKRYSNPIQAKNAISKAAQPKLLEVVKIADNHYEVVPTAAAQAKPILQNRDRSTPASITQMRGIAAKPDYQRVSVSRDFANGAPVVEPGAAVPANRMGRAEVVSTASGRKISTQYAVIESSDLLPSHDINGSQNADYQNGAQGKSRAIAGNGRVTGISHAYTQGTAGEYRRELEADAAGHGISPAAIKGMKSPVLVRIMPQDQITQDIGDESNTATVSALSAAEQASNDAKRIDPASMTFDESGEISEATVRQFILAMPEAERGGLLDGGRPSRQAYERAASAVFATAYESDELIRLQAQATDPEARTVLAGLLAAASKMARLKGQGQWDIRGLVVEAAQAAVNATRNGQTLADYAQQLDIERNPEATYFIDLFAANSRSGKRTGEELSAIADTFYAEASKSETDMFGAVPRRSRQELLGESNGTAEGQPSSAQPTGQPAGPRTTEASRPATAVDDGQQAGAGADAQAETFQLNTQAEEELAALDAANKARIKAEEKAQADADAKQRKADEQAQIKAQSEAQADNFTLGANAEDSLSGQGGMFDSQPTLSELGGKPAATSNTPADQATVSPETVTAPATAEASKPMTARDAEQLLAAAESADGEAGLLRALTQKRENPADKEVIQEAFASIASFYEDAKGVLGVMAKNAIRKLDGTDIKNEIMERLEGDLAGLQLANSDGTQFAFFLPDATEPGRFRASLFDAKGFFGHSTRDTYQQLLDEQFSDGFRTEVTGKLESMAGTDAFAKGNELVAKVQAVNDGRMTWADFIDGEIEASQVNKKFDRWITLAADDVTKLRAVDVERVLNQAQSPDSLKAAAEYLTAKRPDLKGTIGRDTEALMEDNGWSKKDADVAGSALTKVEEWHTPLPERGIALTKEQQADKDGAYRGVTALVAADAMGAVTRTQSMNQQEMSLYYLPESDGVNGAARLIPDGQPMPSNWKKIDAPALSVGAMTREQAVRKITDLLANAAVVGSPSKGKPTTKAKTPAKIENFGEELQGKRSVVPKSLDAELTDEEIASQPLSKLWPPAEIDAMEDTFAAAVAMATRTEIPAKPRKGYKLNGWVEKVKSLRGLARHAARKGRAEFLEELRKLSSLGGFADKVELLESIGREHWKRIGAVSVHPDAYRMVDGKSVLSPFASVEIDEKRNLFGGATSIADTLESVNKLLGLEAAGKVMAFEIRKDRTTQQYSINKTGDKEYRVLKEFATLTEARDFMRDNNADLVAAWDGVKDRDNVKKTDVRNAENRPRTGADYRKGQDVTPEMFVDTLGFRGVEFGNWVGQGANAKERQGMLNAAYDSLVDLAAIIGVPPKAISLNGSLGLAFGSRGKGNAAAHFEPGNLVINLTKTKGAGTLAHEWFHALDNYFARQRGGEVKIAKGLNPQQTYREQNFITYRPEPMYVHKTKHRGEPLSKAKLEHYGKSAGPGGYYHPSNWQLDPSHPQGVRPVVESAFADLVKALDDSPMAKRASANDKSADGYWGRIIERGARAFENYTISKMQEKGYSNDYLANVTEPSNFPRSADRYPYLLPEEMAPISEAFDRVFSTLETKQDDTGNVALFSRVRGATRDGIFLDRGAVQKAAVGAVGDAANRFVYTSYLGLPADVKESAKAMEIPPQEVRAVHWNGTTYLVDGRFKSAEDVERAVFHEHYAHFGLRAKYGTALGPQLRKLLEGVGGLEGVRSLAEQQGIDLSAYEDALAKDKKITEQQKPLVLMDELLAHIAESGGTLKRLIQEYAGMVRDWLRKAGFKRMAELGITDLAFELRGARQAAQRASKNAGDKDVRFSFVGANAETADTYALDEAAARLEQGESANRVRLETGWFKGADSAWRFEIADDEAGFIDPPIHEAWENFFSRKERETWGSRVSPSSMKAAEFKLWKEYRSAVELEYNARNGRRSLGELLDHPKLFAAYPDLKRLQVTFPRASDSRGSYSPAWDSIEVQLTSDTEQMFSTLLHEVQHAIQQRENFAKGGAPEVAFTDAVKGALRRLKNSAADGVLAWEWTNTYRITTAKHASETAQYGLMYESATRLMDHSRRDKPSGVFRNIRNEMQWIYDPRFRGNEKARDLQYAFYEIPKPHNMTKRNAFIGKMAFDAGQLLMDEIPAELRAQFKADPRTMKGMLNALQREASRKRKDLKPLDDLKATAKAAESVYESTQFATTFDVYEALAGEVEARNTQTRQKLTDEERRAKSPASTMDVDPDKLIVMFGGMDVRAPISMASAATNQPATDSNPDIRYRLTDTATKGIPSFSAKAIAKKVSVATGLNAMVVNTESELPAELQAQIKRDGAQGRVAGIYHNGTAYLVASNLRDTQHAISVLLHEAIGHGGVQSVLGDKLGKVMGEIYRDMPKAMRTELERRYAGQMAGMSEAEAQGMIAEEYVAHLAETDPQHSVISRLVALLRKFIRNTFGEAASLKWSRNDLVQLLAEARQSVRDNGKGPQGSSRYRADEGAQALADLPDVSEADESEFVASLKGDTARSFANAMYQARGTESPFFKGWFGKSRMVDKQGQPIAFVHRSYGERDTFADADLGKNTGTPTATLGHFLARKDVGNVERYGPVVEQFYIRMTKPKVVSQDQFEAMGDWSLTQVQAYKKTLMDQGHDGLYIQGLAWPVVFEGKNIKAKRNQGTFDETSSTRYSKTKQTATAAFKKWFGDSKVVDEIRAALEADDDYSDYGLRVIPAGYEVEAGEVLAVSTRWDDGEKTDEELAGTSTVGVSLGRGSIERAIRTIEREGYIGDQVVLVKGESRGAGEDNGELLIKGAEVVVSWSRKSGAGNNGDFYGNNPDTRYSLNPTADALGKLGLGEKESVTLAEKIRAIAEQDWRKTLSDLGKRTNEGLIDGLAGIYNAEKSLGIKVEQMGYVSARMATGLADHMKALLNYGALEWKDGVIQQKANTRGLLDVLTDVGNDDMSAWLGWLGGKRAQLLKREGKENNLSDSDIAELLNVGSKAAKFEAAYQEYAKLNNAILDLAEGAGLIDPKARGGWMTDYYVPFYRQEEGENQFTGPSTKKGLSHQTAAIKALKGGTMPTKDLLENILTAWTKRVDASIKNKAMNDIVANLGDTDFMTKESMKWQRQVISRSELVKMIRGDRNYLEYWAEQLGLDETANHLQVAHELNKLSTEGYEEHWAQVAPTDPAVIRVMVNGKAEYYRVNEPSLLRGLVTMAGNSFNDPVTRAGRWFKRLLTTGITASPDFMARNFLRDAVHAWVINPDGYKLGIDSVKGLRAAWQEDPHYRELMFAGGAFQGGYIMGNDPEAAAIAIRRALEGRGITGKQQADYLGSLLLSPAKMGSALKKGWEHYRDVGDKIENANRLATYKAARAAGKSVRQAAYESKDLMDYSMRGNYAAMVWLTDMVPFLNARLQGLGKLGRAMKGDKTLLAKHVAMKGAYIALFSLLLAGMNDDDDRYKQLEDWDKDANWHFWFSADQVQPFRIPKPFELGLIFGTIPERMMHLGAGSQEAKDFGRAMVHGLTSTLAFNPIPQFYTPIRDIQANRDFFRDSPIEGMADEGKLPAARYDSRTSETARLLGEYTGPTMGLSPKQLQYLWKGYTGTLGGYVLSMADKVAEQMMEGTGEALPVSAADVPVVQAFYKGENPRGTRYQSEFYDMLEEATQLSRTVKSMRAEGRTTDADALRADNRDKIAANTALGRVRQQLGANHAKAEKVRNDKNMSGAQKQSELNRLQLQANILSKRAVDQFGDRF